MNTIRRLSKNEGVCKVKVVFVEDIEEVTYDIRPSPERPGAKRWNGLRSEMDKLDAVSQFVCLDSGDQVVRRVTVDDIDSDDYGVNKNRVIGVHPDDEVENSVVKDALLIAAAITENKARDDSLHLAMAKMLMAELESSRKEFKLMFESFIRMKGGMHEEILKAREEISSAGNGSAAQKAIEMLMKVLAMQNSQGQQQLTVGEDGVVDDSQAPGERHAIWDVLPDFIDQFTEDQIDSMEEGKIKNALKMAKRGISVENIIQSLMS